MVVNERVRALKDLMERSLRATGGDAHEIAEALIVCEGALDPKFSTLPTGKRKVAFTFDPRRAGADRAEEARREIALAGARRRGGRRSAADRTAEDDRHGMAG